MTGPEEAILLGRRLALKMGHSHLLLESVIRAIIYWRDNKDTPEGLKIQEEIKT